MNRRGFLLGALGALGAPVAGAVAGAVAIPTVTDRFMYLSGKLGKSSMVAELQAATRRAFVPKLTVQIYRTPPLLSMLRFESEA